MGLSIAAAENDGDGHTDHMTLASRIAAALAKLPPASSASVAVERDLEATMNDGVKLLADRWYPTGAEATATPVVLLRTPYGRRQWGMIGRLFAERGYQVVLQSCRGTFGSGGNMVPFRNEAADGRATFDWIASEPWFSGRLATFGPSYLGLTQWAIAQDPPDYLKAMALDVTGSNFLDSAAYPSDAFAMETALTWVQQVEHQERGWWRILPAQIANQRKLRAAFDVLPVADADVAAVGRHVAFFQDWIAHEPPGDNWWEVIDFGRQLGAVPPASLVGGWYDIFLRSQLEDYRALRAAGRSVTLTIGPWSHVSPGVFAASLVDGLKLFDSQLRDSATKPAEYSVRLFVMGSRRWVEIPDWPPPFDEQRWYLRDAGRLLQSPAADEPPDRYRYDPSNPTPGIGGPSLNFANAGPKDQRKLETRPDVLTYTSDPLTRDVTVIGPLRAELHVRSSLEHTDFFACLCDVSARGRSKNLSGGLARLRPSEAAKSADGSVSIRVNMWPTANTFKAGHRLRLQVSSGAHPLYARNLGTGEPLATGTTLRAADQEIFHDEEHPSCLVLPVSRLPPSASPNRSFRLPGT
ncbi:MAG: CocE/NonD family hydrolase [Acidimicrobiales bacterium]